MSYRERRIILQNNNVQSKMMAKRLLDKGYKVMLKLPDSEEVVPFPL